MATVPVFPLVSIHAEVVDTYNSVRLSGDTDVKSEVERDRRFRVAPAAIDMASAVAENGRLRTIIVELSNIVLKNIIGSNEPATKVSSPATGRVPSMFPSKRPNEVDQ
jgi:hypothetical protein